MSIRMGVDVEREQEATWTKRSGWHKQVNRGAQAKRKVRVPGRRRSREGRPLSA